MSHPSKTKGARWETAIVGYLQAAGVVHAERRLAGSPLDRGDIAGIPGLVVEAKNEARMSLAEWVDEAEAERVNASAALGVVWHKRRGHASAGEGYVTMTGAQFVWLLRVAGFVP